MWTENDRGLAEKANPGAVQAAAAAKTPEPKRPRIKISEVLPLLAKKAKEAKDKLKRGTQFRLAAGIIVEARDRTTYEVQANGEWRRTDPKPKRDDKRQPPPMLAAPLVDPNRKMTKARLARIRRPADWKKNNPRRGAIYE